jgi:hypothetical protein
LEIDEMIKLKGIIQKESVNEAIKVRNGEIAMEGKWKVYDTHTGNTIKEVGNPRAATRLMNRLMSSGQFKEITTKWMGDSVNEDLDTPAKYSSNEAKLHIDADIKKMSKFLGKASQECIKVMMDGVKGGRYDALDIQRGIKFGPFNRTHEGERPFMSMLWHKVRSGFRRYMPKGKLRK